MLVERVQRVKGPKFNSKSQKFKLQCRGKVSEHQHSKQ
ncbi:MAG: hypothetical protein US50_C0002G0002 [Candidatus Nomurabacteria bacterium GW2011_GWB1_37_5]|uniref:Uncharacterized protein n=1 Tax=Candidatus Nomurabacteria bacterium GW2011_GWB1_37_5 TaxID=1618742 RepID=A0A0G0H170_9BACT|nr:MAG: hypothetical protein US50_C0002G0002 [Candidatus Nomurabacteria bacterium GW2011_GWB1_37_5]